MFAHHVDYELGGTCRGRLPNSEVSTAFRTTGGHNIRNNSFDRCASTSDERRAASCNATTDRAQVIASSTLFCTLPRVIWSGAIGRIGHPMREHQDTWSLLAAVSVFSAWEHHGTARRDLLLSAVVPVRPDRVPFPSPSHPVDPVNSRLVAACRLVGITRSRGEGSTC